MSRTYVEKHCFLCAPGSARELYPRSFSDSDLSASLFTARRVTEHFHYRVVRCEGCGLVYSAEILSDEDLQDLYAESSFVFGEYSSVLRRDYWRPLAGMAARLSGASALEVGCSSGFFLDELLDRGLGRVAGVEPSESAREAASPRVRGTIRPGLFRGRASVGDESFDLVCSFHTLDHVSDPIQVLSDCLDVARPGALVYVVTHDVEALQAKVLGERSPIIDIEHVYLFNRSTLARTLERAGFCDVRVGRLLNSYPLDYWARMVPLPGATKRVLQSGLAASRLGRLRPAFPAGNIYALGRAPG